jgi:mRNA interferase MazF
LILRWSIVRTAFDPVEGHEQAGLRPALVISNEPFNQNSGRATVVPLTTARRPASSSEVLLLAGTAGLPVDSRLLIQQLRTVSQTRHRPPIYGRITDLHLRRLIAQRVLRHLRFDYLDILDLEP